MRGHEREDVDGQPGQLRAVFLLKVERCQVAQRGIRHRGVRGNPGAFRVGEDNIGLAAEVAGGAQPPLLDLAGRADRNRRQRAVDFRDQRPVGFTRDEHERRRADLREVGDRQPEQLQLVDDEVGTGGIPDVDLVVAVGDGFQGLDDRAVGRDLALGVGRAKFRVRRAPFADGDAFL
ncbi:hypothetical protein D9M70_386460 [compost metagenome]